MKKKITAALLGAALSLHALAADPARETAPAGGWAGQAGGTRGGAAATAQRVFAAHTRATLLAALAAGGTAPKIVNVAGIIDMSEGRPYADSRDQAARGVVRIPSNTTLLGVGPNAGFINASLVVEHAQQVIIRNLKIQNPCDVGPVWDPHDGAKGNWNSEFDGISVRASHHVWIDHDSFTDAPVTDATQPVENGMLKQCHDGALDITSGSDFVSVTNNHFADHEKNTLVGGSDRAGGDQDRLRVTFAANLFEHVDSRAPRVRFGQVHVFNNLYIGDKARAGYRHEYSIGVGHLARILSQNNVFDIAGARGCGAVVKDMAPEHSGALADTGSVLNGTALAGCGVASTVGWTPPYQAALLPAHAVKNYVLFHAGAGRLERAGGCPGGAVWCEDFENGAAHAQGSVRTQAGSANHVLLAGPGEPVLTAAAATATAGDYFVEARMRPAAVDGTARRQAWLLGRYADRRNWLGAGLDIAPGTDRMNVVLVKMQDGVLTRVKQVSREASKDGAFHTLRLEFANGALSVYLNGERVTYGEEVPQAAGRIGVLAEGGGFEIDDLRVGPARTRPSRIALAGMTSRVSLQAGDAPRRLAVSALAGDGVSGLPFSASSSDTAVASVAVDGGALVVRAHRPGSAVITLTSLADANVSARVAATVGPAFAAPAQTYALQGRLSPAARAADVPADTPLRITFDRAPTLGAGGSVRIYRAADDALVDVIRVGEEVDAIGYPGQEFKRVVRYNPIRIDGAHVTIHPHNARLADGAGYYVAIDQGVFVGATLGGQPFTGLGKQAGWAFRTRAATPAGSLLSVDDDGPADFRTVQGALNHAMRYLGRDEPVTIRVANGRYEELLYLRDKNRVTLRGESRDGVVIHAANHDSFNFGSGAAQTASAPSTSGGRALFMIEQADLVTLDTLTLVNDSLRATSASAQAETLYFNSDNGRLVATNATFLSEQDTIQVKGYSWFYRTLIAGNVDFIWGANRAALFEESELRSVGDSAAADSGGYLVQARTVTANDPGFVFLNSRLTHGPGPAGNDVPAGATWLARSPGTASTWDNVSFIDCRIDRHVAAAGWAGLGVQRQPAPNPSPAQAGAGWSEYGSMDLAGRPLDLSGRSGGYLLSEAQARARFGKRALVFQSFDGGKGWDPVPPFN